MSKGKQTLFGRAASAVAVLLLNGLVVLGCAPASPESGFSNRYTIAPLGNVDGLVAAREYTSRLESEELRKRLRLDAPLQVLHLELPFFSPDLFAKNPGRVQVWFRIGPAGNVDTVHANAATTQELENVLVVTFLKWRFKPAVRQGKTVAVWMELPFNLSSSPSGSAEPRQPQSATARSPQ